MVSFCNITIFSGYTTRRKSQISELPLILSGNKATDGGNLVLTQEEKTKFVESNPNLSKYIKKYYGSRELINGIQRYCLWITNEQLDDAVKHTEIRSRIAAVNKSRSTSTALSTRNFEGGGHKFIQIQHEPATAILIPEVSSERREYLPICYGDENTVPSNKLFAIFGGHLVHVLGVLLSSCHMTWMKTIAGRLKGDYSYSILCYNTFPFPPITPSQEQTLTATALGILAAREMHPGSTLAELYDPDNMPDNLREAHRTNDLAVEACYRAEPFTSDEERLAYLFKLYEEMIAAEKEKDTLFAIQKKAKKTRKTKK
jgi:hypothetical protein